MPRLCLTSWETRAKLFSRPQLDVIHPYKVILQHGAQWKPIAYVCIMCFCSARLSCVCYCCVLACCILDRYTVASRRSELKAAMSPAWSTAVFPFFL